MVTFYYWLTSDYFELLNLFLFPDGSFLMVTKKPPLILHGQGAAYYLMQFRIIRRRALLREPQLQEPLSQGPL